MRRGDWTYQDKSWAKADFGPRRVLVWFMDVSSPRYPVALFFFSHYPLYQGSATPMALRRYEYTAAAIALRICTT